MSRALALFILPLLLWGCAAETRYRVASFLFDGVPPPAPVQEQPGAASPGTAETGEAQQAPPAARPAAAKPAQPAAPGSTHRPYGERSCASCHDRDASNRLVREGNELCFNCHQGVLTGKRVAHVPAVAECLLCHRPHSSENVRLLEQPLPDLCLMCHDRQEMFEVHGEIGACLSCHNPHESDEDRLLDFE